MIPEVGLFWLLLPLAAGASWWAARRGIARVSGAQVDRLRSTYFRGLNYLLNEQPDKAIDAFIEAVKIDNQTVELHFALGSLFRRRGETDRAIRMHQNLIDRDDLSEDQRLQALSELGLDFLKAGLLDRAEAVFLQLRGSRLNDFALKNLLDIYQQEKDWRKAIETAEALPGHESALWEKEMANFHCELASADMANSRFDDAHRSLMRALEMNRKCVRASMLLGDLHVAQGDDRAALEAWKRVESQNPVYLALVAERLMDTYRRLGELDQGMQLLRSYLEKYASLDLLDALFQWELQKEGPAAAYQLVRDELRRNPTLLGLDKLLEAALLTAPLEQRNDIELVKGLVHGHTRRVARYRCDACGFKARQFYWRCPACGGWETYPPKRTEEFDLTP